MRACCMPYPRLGVVFQCITTTPPTDSSAHRVYLFSCVHKHRIETEDYHPGRDKKQVKAGTCLLMGQLVPQEVQHDAKNLGFPSLRGVHE